MLTFESNNWASGVEARRQAVVHLAREADFRLGDLVVRPSSRQVVCVCGLQAQLEPRVMQVLVALARMGGRVVSRDDLIDTCWGGRIVGEDAINRCIGRLRRLAETLGGGYRIETIARVGYRLAPSGPASAPLTVRSVMAILARITQAFARRTQRA
jgi:DNA-binding winged helix-turn-helix (wHTH) protein